MVESFNAMLPALLEYSPYLAIFTLLVVGIWLVPFAEEIALTSAGYLYFVGEVHLYGQSRLADIRRRDARCQFSRCA